MGIFRLGGVWPVVAKGIILLYRMVHRNFGGLFGMIAL